MILPQTYKLAHSSIDLLPEIQTEHSATQICEL